MQGSGKAWLLLLKQAVGDAKREIKCTEKFLAMSWSWSILQCM